MPLTACPDCNRPVSDQAPTCPHCGRPMFRTIDRPQPAASGTLSQAAVAQAMKEGHQRAKLRRSVGNLVTFAAILIGGGVMFVSPVVGLLVILGGIGAGMCVKYGW